MRVILDWIAGLFREKSISTSQSVSNSNYDWSDTPSPGTFQPLAFEHAMRLLLGGRNGIKEWNKRNTAGIRMPAVRFANLCELDLAYIEFRGADLRQANLRRADLRFANLREANLSGADLCHANLSQADIRFANLQGANLEMAALNDASLTGEHLEDVSFAHADLSGADLSETKLVRTALNGAKLIDADLPAMTEPVHLRDLGN